MNELLFRAAGERPFGLTDAHVHLDFMANGEEVAAAARAAGVRLLAATVTPDGFRAARERFGAFDNVDVGLGLHPWWVESEADAGDFIALLPEAELVSEVGLDFGKRHLDTRDMQTVAFRKIARACAEAGGKTLSIHSVHAARDVLDILEESGTLESCTCIFHWFTGPSDQLKRAIDAGCLFSVGLRMLATGKGREYVKGIPADRLLFETDAPAERGQRCDFGDLLSELNQVAEGVDAIKMKLYVKSASTCPSSPTLKGTYAYGASGRVNAGLT